MGSYFCVSPISLARNGSAAGGLRKLRVRGILNVYRETRGRPLAGYDLTGLALGFDLKALFVFANLSQGSHGGPPYIFTSIFGRHGAPGAAS